MQLTGVTCNLFSWRNPLERARCMSIIWPDALIEVTAAQALKARSLSPFNVDIYCAKERAEQRRRGVALSCMKLNNLGRDRERGGSSKNSTCRTNDASPDSPGLVLISSPIPSVSSMSSFPGGGATCEQNPQTRELSDGMDHKAWRAMHK